MRVASIGVSCVFVLCGFAVCPAQQPTGPATLENLLRADGTPAQRPVAVDASEPATPAGLPAGRVQGSVTRPKDGVRHPDLDAAWSEYDQQVERIAKAIEQAIEEELNAAAAAGDLDGSLKWKTAGEQFQKDGRIPDGLDGRKSEGRPKPKPAKVEALPHSRVATAHERLVASYEEVEKELVKSHDFEKAKQVRAEKIVLGRGGSGGFTRQANEEPAKPVDLFIGRWRHPNGNIEELHADGRWIVNGDPKNPWSGTWFLDAKDPNRVCVVREANNKTTSRAWLHPADPNALSSGSDNLRDCLRREKGAIGKYLLIRPDGTEAVPATHCHIHADGRFEVIGQRDWSGTYSFTNRDQTQLSRKANNGRTFTLQYVPEADCLTQDDGFSYRRLGR